MESRRNIHEYSVGEGPGGQVYLDNHCLTFGRNRNSILLLIHTSKLERNI